jgi:hypothetical protein
MIKISDDTKTTALRKSTRARLKKYKCQGETWDRIVNKVLDLLEAKN